MDKKEFSPLEYLVELVGDNRMYLSFKAPRDPRVLQAMREIDRMLFIPPGVFATMVHVDPEAVITLDGVAQQLVREMGGSQRVASLLGAGEPLPEANPESVLDLLSFAVTISQTARTFSAETRGLAYNDMPLDIGYGQTCSQPSLVALMDDLLELQPGMKVLEVGAGCLYHAAITKKLVGEEGEVYSMECQPQLVKLAKENNIKYCDDGINVIEGDGSLGLLEEAPFDRIYLTAGALLPEGGGSFRPGVLIEQLSPGGILLVPEEKGRILKYEFGSSIPNTVVDGISFVPLRGDNC